MEKFKKWGAFIAFLIMAGISCWATEHSFHLLIKWMPEALVWGLTIAFFIVASYGTKLIVDSLNTDIWLEHRRRDFWIGTVLMVIFWLLMSMPTNTHTFFYNHKIGNVAQEDLKTTKGYLSQINNRVITDSTYYFVHERVNKEFNNLTNEYNGRGRSGKKGGGEYVREHLRNINTELEKELPGTAIPFKDSEWNVFNPTTLSGYERQMNRSLELIKDKNYKVSRSESSLAADDIRKIELMEDTIAIMVESGNIHEDVITQAEGVLLNGYTCIKNNNKFVNFDNDKEEKLYTAENLETKTKRMLSVIDVWIDFFNGKYPISFFFYILLSILVDVAAFMFFAFAFKKEY